ncbi:hypothetical protein DFH27DRAFT_557838 [Peziza echinospora]|nr:hypothetical protein DFH27DRAFT_557838 [Peziza echinospora]
MLPFFFFPFFFSFRLNGMFNCQITQPNQPHPQTPDFANEQGERETKNARGVRSVDVGRPACRRGPLSAGRLTGWRLRDEARLRGCS